jgi:hypothetical protein
LTNESDTGPLPAILPVDHTFSFAQLCELFALHADLDEREPPTAGEIYDLVNGWAHGYLGALKHERSMDLAVKTIRATKIRLGSLRVNGSNGSK